MSDERVAGRGRSGPDRTAAAKPDGSHDGPAAAQGPKTDQPGRLAMQPEDSSEANAKGTMTRRGALKVIATTAAAGAVASCAPEDAVRGTDSAHESLSGFEPVPPTNPRAAGTLTDPDMLSPVVPWEMVLTDEEMRQVAALADVIIPADDRSPAASAVGVPDYINEFVSAPAHKDQLTQLRGGLAWLNRTAQERFGAVDFSALATVQRHEICDEICFEPNAPEALKPQARFFDGFRDWVSTGFWTTEEGMRDLGYVGNVPVPSWDGPPA
ncbi:MAG: gluconate 2-dehydrogenase subunit 3 family protein, partial [Gemmatimonadetes bacterium]|nr:gluconate 2-dehydrogenase subunit 3 family protein [Gemmatimonadota bacterium]